MARIVALAVCALTMVAGPAALAGPGDPLKDINTVKSVLILCDDAAAETPGLATCEEARKEHNDIANRAANAVNETCAQVSAVTAPVFQRGEDQCAAIVIGVPVGASGTTYVAVGAGCGVLWEESNGEQGLQPGSDRVLVDVGPTCDELGKVHDDVHNLSQETCATVHASLPDLPRTGDERTDKIVDDAYRNENSLGRAACHDVGIVDDGARQQAGIN